MKLITTFSRRLAALVATALLASSAYAVPINISNNGVSLVGDIQFGLLGNNDPEDSFDYLVNPIIPGYESITGNSLPDPVFSSLLNFGSNPNPEVDVTGYDYAVLHYGVGRNGVPPGGGIVFYYLNGQTGNFTFPTDGQGPNGFGGLSSIRLFGAGETNVPDGGATAALLGLGVLGLAVLRRKS